jgi:predicted LPLAT superfamily acyltransferase
MSAPGKTPSSPESRLPTPPAPVAPSASATPPATTAGSSDSPAPRNPGPSWGYRLIRFLDRVLPEFLYRPLRAAGTWVSVAAMPRQRRHSRDYLRAILGREPRLIEIFRHFFTFEESLMVKLRAASGHIPRTVLAPGSEHFKTFVNSGRYAFLGTFHVGHSDLLGFLLGPVENHRVFMVRQRVGNSHDTDKLGALFGQWIKFIWVNEPENLLFALKEAVASGGSVALKCDRLEFSAKTDSFDFLGARRVFPFTIYHLALIFDLPVLLTLGVPGAPGETLIHSSPRWEPDKSLSRAANLVRAHAHFQDFLHQLEAQLRLNPYLWFNFIELNPPASAQPPAATPTFPRRPLPAR